MANIDSTAWYRLDAAEVATKLNVDPARGLDAAEVVRRRSQHGPNRLAEKVKEPGWKAFLRQYRELMQIILLVTGIVALVALGDTKTFVILAILATQFHSTPPLSVQKT